MPGAATPTALASSAASTSNGPWPRFGRSTLRSYSARAVSEPRTLEPELGRRGEFEAEGACSWGALTCACVYMCACVRMCCLLLFPALCLAHNGSGASACTYTWRATCSHTRALAADGGGDGNPRRVLVHA